MKDTQIHIAKNLRWSVLTKIFFSLLLIIMDPFSIGVRVGKILLEPEMEVVIPRTVGVEKGTTGSPGPLSGEIGSSQILSHYC